MRYTLAALLVCLAVSNAHADTHLVYGANVYKVPASYATPDAPYQGLFLRLNIKVDKKTGAPSFAFAKELERLRYLQGTKTETVETPEGCGKHPMEWLHKAHIVGWFKKSRPGVLIQAFEKATIVPAPEKPVPACPKDEHLETSTFLRSGDDLFAYVVCSADLNAQLRVMRLGDNGAWAPNDAFTVTDNCP